MKKTKKLFGKKYNFYCIDCGKLIEVAHSGIISLKIQKAFDLCSDCAAKYESWFA